MDGDAAYGPARFRIAASRRLREEIELDFDIAIVGAGVAGLAAGRTLATAGWRVVVIEARDRVGGRIFTTQAAGGVGHAPVPIELGAEFIHGRPPETWALLREAQLDTFEIAGASLCCVDGTLQVHDEQREGGIAALERMRQWLGAQSPPRDMSFNEYLAQTALDAAAHARAVEYVEGFNAADSAVIGVAALARQQQAEDEIGSDRLSRVQRGYQALPEFLARELVGAGGTLLLNSVARRIAWQPGAVAISGVQAGEQAFTLVADRALVCVPLGVLQADSIEFAPRPGRVLRHARRLRMGPVVRVTLVFRKRFWAKLYVPEASAEVQSGLERLSFLFTHGVSPATWWTSMPHTDASITAWAGGPRATVLQAAARRMGQPDALLQLCLTGLADAFDLPVERLQKQLLSWHTHDWQADPYAMGAYSYAPAGALDASALMSAPVQDTLYFAGEHTDVSGHWGTVHAALRSGLRAAEQLGAQSR